MKPKYCTNPDAPDCWECDMASRGKDCRNHSILAVAIGSRTSAKKAKSSRENGKKGGRPRKDSPRSKKSNKNNCLTK